MSGAPDSEVPYQFHFVAAPADLAPYLNSLYIWDMHAPCFKDILPAYSGQLVSFVKGEASMVFEDGVEQHASGASFLAPLLQAMPFTVYGPARCFGVSLNFRGWAALTNLAVPNWNNCIFELEHGLGPDLADRFRDLGTAWQSGKLDDSAMLDGMAQVVRDGLRKLPEQHAKVIDHTHQWLSSSFKPELEDLYSALPYSERQVQRLVSRFFGQSPIRLIRRYRAVRAATLLSFPQLPDEIEAEIRDAFYDQAHMIKEIRFFTGRTPRRLLPLEGSLVQDMLGADGYGSVDLYAGIEAQQLGRDLKDC